MTSISLTFERGERDEVLADIEPGTVLFDIPREAIICPTTSELARLVPSIIQGNQNDDDDDHEDDDNRNQDPWTSLILTMIYEFLRGDRSPWKAYFDVLPAVFDTPMFWTEDELAALQASPVVDRVGRAEADNMIKSKVLPVIRKHSSIFFTGGSTPLTDNELIDLAHRMGSTIMAYSFSLETDSDKDDENESDDGDDGDAGDEGDEDDESNNGESDSGKRDRNKNENDHISNPDHNRDGDGDSEDGDGWVEDKDDQLPLGMVPMADMLNSDAEFNAHINHGVDTLTATAVRFIKAGEEILNYYGPLSNGELLRRYGYTTEKHSHFDAVDLPWGLVRDALASQLGIESTEAIKISEKMDADEIEDPIMLDRDFNEDEVTGRLSTPTTGRVLSELPSSLDRQARSFVKLALREHLKKGTSNSSTTTNQAPSFRNDHNNGLSYVENNSRSAKEIATAAIASAIMRRLETYPTTLENDIVQFKALEREAPLSPSLSRLYAALRVRIGEKRLLQEATALAELAAEAARTKKSVRRKKGARESGLEKEQPARKREKNAN
ncbi:set domain containing protein [Niveomyces insectorum RCEF 264]|uniref:Set domain containing protein n=1 Tax=Niveomyces insectorum RCEF 264 TaxID=1081102 RepID=A0A167NG25_9HYPO|nr:set domain containing protein [Niveomyces insectorum RCEF 264]